MKKISLVIPVHNEEKNVPVVYKESKKVLEDLRKNKGYDYEIIFINDGSSDQTLEVLKSLKNSDSFLRILNMDKNRGQA
ncbi:MAG: glycosyltransferase, partial [Thermodesulfobacterium geofontis]